MKTDYHPPYHWIAVALVTAAFLFAVSTAYGQATGANAVFEGRPAMAGAQGGIGAQAGPPQGGIGVQGADASQRTLRILGAPPYSGAYENFPQGTPATGPGNFPQGTPATAREVEAVSEANRAVGDDAKAMKKRDSGVAKDQTGAKKSTQRAAKRTTQQSRTGVGQFDSTNTAPPADH